DRLLQPALKRADEAIRCDHHALWFGSFGEHGSLRLRRNRRRRRKGGDLGNLGPGMEGGSSASPVSLSIFWVAGTAAAAVYVAGVSPELNQSGGAATMPQTFAGCSSSTPICCSSRLFGDA